MTRLRRCEKTYPGELVHVAIKKLGRVKCVWHRITGHHRGMTRNRGIGWEFAHVSGRPPGGIGGAAAHHSAGGCRVNNPLGLNS